MTLHLFQARVLEEKQELDGRLARLDAFLRSPNAAQLEQAEAARMDRQAEIMRQYSAVLSERIAAFGATA